MIRNSVDFFVLIALTVQGSEVTLPSGSSSYSAIDTGTTLVGGPSDLIADLFAQIPDSEAGTGDYEGYYIYRTYSTASLASDTHFDPFIYIIACDTTVNVTIAFGGQNWPISAEDFQLTKLSSTQCLGAFFELTTGSSAPSWIVGDTFLVRFSFYHPLNNYILTYLHFRKTYTQCSDTTLPLSDSPSYPHTLRA